jgi:ankyrin repeat protein
VETSLDEYAPNLNPMLNIGFKKPSVVILRATAIFGILLHTATFEEVDRHSRDGMSHLVTPPGKIWRYLMEELLERHPYIPPQDRHGRDALSWAYSEGYQEAIDQLIRAGCSLKARDRRNWTPVHHVTANNRLEVL